MRFTSWHTKKILLAIASFTLIGCRQRIAHPKSIQVGQIWKSSDAVGTVAWQRVEFITNDEVFVWTMAVQWHGSSVLETYPEHPPGTWNTFTSADNLMSKEYLGDWTPRNHWWDRNWLWTTFPAETNEPVNPWVYDGENSTALVINSDTSHQEWLNVQPTDHNSNVTITAWTTNPVIFETNGSVMEIKISVGH